MLYTGEEVGVSIRKLASKKAKRLPKWAIDRALVMLCRPAFWRRLARANSCTHRVDTECGHRPDARQGRCHDVTLTGPPLFCLSSSKLCVASIHRQALTLRTLGCWLRLTTSGDIAGAHDGVIRGLVRSGTADRLGSSRGRCFGSQNLGTGAARRADFY